MSEAARPTADRCVEARRIAEERCALAARAREEATAAAERLRSAQRAYDDHLRRADEAAAAADARAVRVAKEMAQGTFRIARGAARTREEVEAAARDWLREINRINRATRAAATALQREREAATAMVSGVERLGLEANAARIAAEAADDACTTARQAFADCEEAVALEGTAAWPPAPSTGVGGGRTGVTDDETQLAWALTATGAGEPAILRLLRGDRATLVRLVDALGGDDPAQRRRWQLALSGLVDAIVAGAIEVSALAFPEEHPFWGRFTRAEGRAIAAALGSLGYGFDGLGGWADERMPGQRDLSLAVGYAGLDPMRIRRWPNEAETRDLLREVIVVADEYLADGAGELTLGELVDLLGRRADGLADLWTDWGRVRPLLLSGG